MTLPPVPPEKLTAAPTAEEKKGTDDKDNENVGTEGNLVTPVTPIRKESVRDKTDSATNVDAVDAADTRTGGNVEGNSNDSWDLDAVMAANPKMVAMMQGFRKATTKSVYSYHDYLELFDWSCFFHIKH